MIASLPEWWTNHGQYTLVCNGNGGTNYPTYSSWLNLVERWFGELTSKWIRRGTHRSVKELVASMRTWIATWNDDPRPYVWHKSAEEILEALAGYCRADS